MKFYSLAAVMDEHPGLISTPKRDTFEEQLRFDVLSKAIKEDCLQRSLPSSSLGNW